MSKADVVEFTIPGRAPQAMSPNARAHWTAKRGRASEGQRYREDALLIIQSAKPARFGSPWQRAHMTVTQRAVRLRDGDNFLASFKPGLDAIVRAGVLADDKPSCVEIITVKHEKVKHEREEEVVVCIQKL